LLTAAGRGGVTTKVLFLASIAVIALAAQPAAADFPPIWNGFYVGGNAGYAWDRLNVVSVFNCRPPGADCPYENPINHAAFGAGASGSPRPDGFAGGVQAGYNWQAGGVVFGVEADFSSFVLKTTLATKALVPVGIGQNFTSTATAKTDWVATLRARVGWTVMPTVLLYATGGLAVTKLNVTNSFTDDCPPACAAIPPFDRPLVFGTSNNNRTQSGWSAGAGVEWLMNLKWSAKVEYLYVEFDPIDTTLWTTTQVVGGPVPNSMTTSAGFQANIVRGGVNYRF
jgi:outer membrane immunogenic protein